MLIEMKGSEYDHDSDSFMGAIGVSKERMEELKHMLADSAHKQLNLFGKDKFKNSRIVEDVITKLDSMEEAIVVGFILGKTIMK